MQNIRKRYASDCNSSNLKDDERNHNTDTLHAVALGTDDFGAMLLRAKYAKHIPKQLYLAWRNKVAKRADKRGWLPVAEEVADISLQYYLNESRDCSFCNGRGHAVITGSPTLSDVTCEPCNGTGQKPVLFDPEIRSAVNYCLEWLGYIDSRESASSIRKLGE